MKKTIKLLALMCAGAMALGLMGCSSSSDTLVMGTEAGFAPFEYYDGEAVVGVDVDIANEIAKDMGKKLEISDMTFDAVLAAVPSGKVDFGAAGLSVTPERQESMDFSVEYATSKQVILIPDNSPIAAPEEIADKTVGVQTGTTADMYLSEEYPENEPKRYNKYLDALADLKAGRIDAIVMDVLPAEQMLKENEGFKLVEKELFTDKYAIAVKKGNAALLESINKTLERLMSEGKIEEYIVKHSTK